MSTNDCIQTISAAIGRKLSNEEIRNIADEVEARITSKLKRGEFREDAALSAGRQLAGEELLAALIEKRNAAINIRVRQAVDLRIAPEKEAEGIRAILTGAHGVFAGAARSIDAMRHGLFAERIGGMIADLKREGLMNALMRRDKNFDRDVAVELWALREPSSARPTHNPQAYATAQILNKYQEALRGDLNNAGAWIGKQDNYVVRQSHDMLKVRGDGSAAAFQTWREVIEPKLDERTFDGRPDRTEFLRNVWKALSSGVHEIAKSETMAGFTGPGSLAKRVSHERLLHFKGPDAWFDYNEQFGKGAVIDAVGSAIEKGTRDLALMRTLGTNPEAMYQAVRDKAIAEALNREDFRTVDRLKGQTNDKIMAVLTGAADIPAHTTWAKIGSTVRVLESMSKLGGVVLSSIPDLAVNAAMLRHNGVPLFEAYARQMHGLLPMGPERREIADMLGVGIDHMLGTVMHRFQAEDGALGKMSAAARTFYRLTGLTYWTDSLKASSGLMLSSNLAERAGTAFGSLNSRFQATLLRYGIDEAEWAKLAAEKQIAADGRHYILPAHVQDRELADKLSTYITDQVREGMTEPTAFNRVIATGGLQRGTGWGEGVRLIMQFKQYAITYLDRTVGRELYRGEGKDVGGLAHLIVATTALGYLSMTLKELAKGRNPRSPESKGDYLILLGAAMIQGGGAGIYGDFLFGEANRMGGGVVDTFFGPTAGTVKEAHRVWADTLRQDGHPLAEAFGAVKNSTPFLNLFYTRAVLDHLVLFRMQEWANPGYLRRYEQRVKKENKQTFWLSPSATAF
jgi:hypothetical protein